MPQKNSYFTASDQFCGAGGSSDGAQESGFEIKLALNHWKLAIETHNSNFPDAIHECTDISACDPRRYPSTDLLITSPECTNHSVSNGKKKPKAQLDLYDSGVLDPAAERSRATMWDVVRFAEYHKYNAIITENVVDARKWILYDSWIYAMRNLGYEHKCCFLNSMHFWPTPQSRDRMYVVFWKKGNKAPDLDYMPLAHCPKCSCNVNAIQSWKRNQKSWKYGARQGYVYCCPVCSTVVEPYYYAAFNCIDWSMPGTRIGDRKIPLRPNTERRVRKGIDMYGDYPFMVTSAYTGVENRVYDVNNVTPPFTTQNNLGVAMSPFLINNQHKDHADNRYRNAITETMHTSTGFANFGLVAPPPMIVKNEHAGSQSGSYIRPATRELPTTTTSESTGILMTGCPFIVELNSTGKMFPADESAASTFTAGGNNQGLVMVPMIIENKGKSNARSAEEAISCFTTHTHHGILTDESFQSFLTYQNGGSDVNSHISKAAGAFATNDRHALVSYSKPNYEDCYYRTLKAHEVKKGMAFRNNYIILGDAKSQVRQLGNAVTPPAMKWLSGQVRKSLE